MSDVSTPFNYRDNLIGEEIIYRALLQQERYAGEANKFGAEWDVNVDGVVKSGMYFKASVLRTDFAIASEFQHCMPYPPCPWRKDEDILRHADLKPIIMGPRGVYTYAFDVYKRSDQDTSRFTIGDHLMSYTIDNSELSAAIRAEFTYYSLRIMAAAPGEKAVVVVQQGHRGSIDRHFYYLFTFE
jgi:hypothetical protein